MRHLATTSTGILAMLALITWSHDGYGDSRLVHTRVTIYGVPTSSATPSTPTFAGAELDDALVTSLFPEAKGWSACTTTDEATGLELVLDGCVVLELPDMSAIVGEGLEGAAVVTDDTCVDGNACYRDFPVHAAGVVRDDRIGADSAGLVVGYWLTFEFSNYLVGDPSRTLRTERSLAEVGEAILDVSWGSWGYSVVGEFYDVRGSLVDRWLQEVRYDAGFPEDCELYGEQVEVAALVDGWDPFGELLFDTIWTVGWGGVGAALGLVAGPAGAIALGTAAASLAHSIARDSFIDPIRQRAEDRARQMGLEAELACLEAGGSPGSADPSDPGGDEEPGGGGGVGGDSGGTVIIETDSCPDEVYYTDDSGQCVRAECHVLSEEEAGLYPELDPGDCACFPAGEADPSACDGTGAESIDLPDPT